MKNDILDFSMIPGVVTDHARQIAEEFIRKFGRVFSRWYVDVTKASQKNRRKCLTNNFPYDSPGNLNKDCVATKAQLEIFSKQGLNSYYPRSKVLQNTDKDNSGLRLCP